MWWLYNLLFAIGFPLLLPHFLWRMWRRGGYGPGFWQRVGYYAPAVRRRLAARRRYWIHAVSVGEMYVALRFIAEWRAREPGAAFVISTTTSTGHAIAASHLGTDDVLIYFPADFPFIVGRVLRRLRPLALILTEGEYWPNLLRRAHAGGVPLFVINARVSARSFRGYRRLGGFFSGLMQRFALLLAQGDEDARCLLALGAVPGRVRALGTAKYDIDPAAAVDAGEVHAWLAAAGIDPAAPLLVGGSTWEGEEQALLAAYRALRAEFPALRLVLVPRHAERRVAVAADVVAAGFDCILRSAQPPQPRPAPDSTPAVFVVDSTGELTRFYAAATLIFVGKSLTQHGGQNIIEPAVQAKPILVGPHLENFPVVAADFRAAGALVQVQDAAGLEAAVRDLLRAPARRQALGAAARGVVEAKQGVMRASVDLIRAALETAAPPPA